MNAENALKQLGKVKYVVVTNPKDMLGIEYINKVIKSKSET